MVVAGSTTRVTLRVKPPSMLWSYRVTGKLATRACFAIIFPCAVAWRLRCSPVPRSRPYSFRTMYKCTSAIAINALKPDASGEYNTFTLMIFGGAVRVHRGSQWQAMMDIYMAVALVALRVTAPLLSRPSVPIALPALPFFAIPPSCSARLLVPAQRRDLQHGRLFCQRPPGLLVLRDWHLQRRVRRATLVACHVCACMRTQSNPGPCTPSSDCIPCTAHHLPVCILPSLMLSAASNQTPNHKYGAPGRTCAGGSLRAWPTPGV